MYMYRRFGPRTQRIRKHEVLTILRIYVYTAYYIYSILYTYIHLTYTKHIPHSIHTITYTLHIEYAIHNILLHSIHHHHIYYRIIHLPSVPDKPIDKPTSAAFNAGPSFVPSPVTPTTSPPDSARLLLHSSVYIDSKEYVIYYIRTL